MLNAIYTECHFMLNVIMPGVVAPVSDFSFCNLNFRVISSRRFVSCRHFKPSLIFAG